MNGNEGVISSTMSILNLLDNEKETVTEIEEEYQPDEFQEDGFSSDIIDTETTFLTPEQIEEFFKATEDGSIKRLDQLFHTKLCADPNMTRFTESLLMAAIRTKRNEVAEYLIDQLAINVKHSTDLLEFRLHSQIPIRQRIFSCRDLAYDKGMMELVDLIDITSDDVTPSIKRYLQRRLQSRLDLIHQAYLKRLKESNKHSPFRSQEKELPTVNMTDENSLSSSMLPNIHRPYKSHIEEAIQSINTTIDKSIDETGRKTFRFSNYTLRFRLEETTDKPKEQSQSRTSTFSLPIIPQITSFPSPLATTNNNRRSISEASARFSMRDSRTSICPSARQITTPSIVITPNKSAPTPTRRLLSKRVNQNNTNHSYIPQQQQHSLYNQPRRFVPVTLKATAISLPSDTRLIRD